MTTPPVRRDPWAQFRSFTKARIGLERSGDALTTRDLLKLQLDHAHARDAVQRNIDFTSIRKALEVQCPVMEVTSAAATRSTYIRRPDLGRQLSEASRVALTAGRSDQAFDALIVIGDGLSSAAIEDHAVPMTQACLRRLQGWHLAPIVLASQSRVALGDEISRLLNADLCVMLIGERPGLTVANSLSAYITWKPTVGHRDADRNCLSNIHRDGLSYEEAAEKAVWLLTQAKQRQLTGTGLKEDAPATAAAITRE